MNLRETSISGCYLVEGVMFRDFRGDFMRKYDANDFEKNGLNSSWVQINLSTNVSRGTLRGMHYQTGPDSEIKLVTCVQGLIFDSVVDLRPSSISYLKSESFLLPHDSNQAIYIPAGCAHGYQTLKDNSTLLYLVSQFYNPVASRGLRYDDSILEIDWPMTPSTISDADLSWRPFTRDED